MSGEGSGRPPETIVGFLLCIEYISGANNLKKNLIVFEHPVEWLVKQRLGTTALLWWTHITATRDEYQRWSSTIHVEPVPSLQTGRQEQVQG